MDQVTLVQIPDTHGFPFTEAYANLLYNWQCFQQRCEVLKRSQQPPALRRGLGGEVEVEVTISCPCQADSAKLKQEQPFSFRYGLLKTLVCLSKAIQNFDLESSINCVPHILIFFKPRFLVRKLTYCGQKIFEPSPKEVTSRITS